MTPATLNVLSSEVVSATLSFPPARTSLIFVTNAPPTDKSPVAIILPPALI